MTSVWLRGEKFSTYYLLDTQADEPPQKFVLDEHLPTAGLGQWCGTRFVAIYSDPTEAGVCVQVDRLRLPLDGRTHARRTCRLLRTLSVAHIWRDGADTVVVRQWTPWRLLRTALDLTYDALDEADEDFLGEIARLVSDIDVHDFRKRNRPTAGPWHLVDAPV